MAKGGENAKQGNRFLQYLLGYNAFLDPATASGSPKPLMRLIRIISVPKNDEKNGDPGR